jgi:hypothetical protein
MFLLAIGDKGPTKTVRGYMADYADLGCYAIQRRGSILAWIVILSVYGADTIAIDLSLSG